MNEINRELEKILDKHFPKGCKERGKALTLFARAQCKIEEAHKKGVSEEKQRILRLIEKWSLENLKEIAEPTWAHYWCSSDDWKNLIREIENIDHYKGEMSKNG